jgi:hypothetical protein
MSDTPKSDRIKRLLQGRTSQTWMLPSAADIHPPVIPSGRPDVSAGLSSAITVTPGAKLGKDERGVIWPILPADAFQQGDTLSFFPFTVPYEEMRTCLLLFDRFDIPRQMSLGHENWCRDELESVGVLSSSDANVSGNMSRVIRELPFNTFLARERIEPGLWAMARPAQALGIPAANLTANAGVAMTIQNAMPTFTKNVPLEDVLEFKRRAWSELVALRTHIDDVVKDVGQNGANDLTNTTAFKNFEKSLAAHIRLMNESNHAKVWHSLKASCDLPSASAPLADLIFTGTIDYHSLGAGAIAIGIRTVNGLRRKRDSLNPFEYLTSASLAL